jgi:transcriptional regulator with XRE-family HTH domain
MQTQHPLRQWRKTHKIVLKNLAYDAGTTIATISRIERGMQFPRWGLLFKLVKITGLRLDDFMPMGPE